MCRWEGINLGEVEGWELPAASSSVEGMKFFLSCTRTHICINEMRPVAVTSGVRV